ncbi:MAG: biopolymer transporter ExbD [Nannocystaceae bacterium]
MARKKSKEAPVEEANVLPVMNIMFLLIPALLLAMEVASLAAITVAPPKFAAAPSETPPEKPEKEPLKLKVFILEDGFRVSAAGQQEGAAAGREADSSKPSIPLKKPGAPLDDYERFDFAALEAKAAEYKLNYKTETVVTISAENTIPMQVLVNTMDALRGTGCKLLKAMQAGEEIPPECLFWQPIVEAGAG